jgi:hypothetical protein
MHMWEKWAAKRDVALAINVFAATNFRQLLPETIGQLTWWRCLGCILEGVCGGGRRDGGAGDRESRAPG